MGQSEMQDEALAYNHSHLYLCWSILDPGLAVPQGPTTFLDWLWLAQEKVGDVRKSSYS